MNKQINFEQFGGYPLTQDDLGWMQDSYTKAISTIAAAFGQYVILNGVEAQNGYYSEGWIIIDKVLLPFRKSQIAAQIVVNETKNSRLFADGATYDVLSEKYAISANTGGISFGNFVRIKPYAQHMSSTDSAIYNSQQDIYNLQQAVAAIAQVPKGMISMWSGSVTALPAGWALCDGTNNTPNLMGRFIVGYSRYEPDYNTIGNRGGENTHKLTSKEQGSLKLKVRSDDGDGNTGSFRSITAVSLNGTESWAKALSSEVWSDEVTVRLSSDASSHENRPPYYTLAYIMKL